MFLKLLPSCKSVHPLQRSYLKLLKYPNTKSKVVVLTPKKKTGTQAKFHIKMYKVVSVINYTQYES